MRKRLQNILFFIVSTIVIVGGGFVALMAARGTLITPGGLTQTGTLRVNATPNVDIQVFLDEQEKQLSNSNTIDNILPGEYELRVQKDGFNTWRQRVVVTAGLVADISVQLFPGTIPPEQITKTGIQKFTTGSSRRYMYYTVLENSIGTNIGIWQHNLQPSSLPLVEERPVKITNITDEIRDAVTQNNYQVLPSPNDSKLLLVMPAGVYVLDTNRYNEPNAVTNKIVFTYPLDSVEWLTDSSNLLIRSGELLFDYDLDKKLASLITYQAGQQPIFTKAGGAIYYLANDRLMKYTPGSSTQVKLENVVLPKGINRLFSGNNDSSVLIQAGSNLHYLDITSSSLTDIGGYELLTIAPTGRDLLVKQNDKVVSIEVDVSLVRGVVDVIRRDTQIPADMKAESIKWAPNSVYFTFTTAANPNKLQAADKNGGSISTLLDSAKIVINTATIASDNTSVLLQLIDSEEPNVQRSNVYKLDLKGSN